MNAGGGDGLLGEPWLPEELVDALRTAAAAEVTSSARSLQGAFDRLVADLFYCVVDEIVEDRLLLIACRWPSIDEDDRQMFPERAEDEFDEDGADENDGSDWVLVREDPYREIGLSLDTFEEFLAQRRRSDEADGYRPITIGDVFAMGSGALEELKQWEEAALFVGLTDFGEPRLVVDVTASARGAAKAAFSRVVAPPPADGPLWGEPGPGHDPGFGPPAATSGPPADQQPGGGTALPSPWIPEELDESLGLLAVRLSDGGRASQEDQLNDMLAKMRYCVVDEVVGDRVLLIATTWPVLADGEARLFPAPPGEGPGDADEMEESRLGPLAGSEPVGSGYREIGVGRRLLQRFLERYRQPGVVPSDRPVRIGDVYAIEHRALVALEEQDRQGRDRLDDASPEYAVYDLSQAGRLAAKVDFLRIVAPESGPSLAGPNPDDDLGPASSTDRPVAPAGKGPGGAAEALQVPPYRRHQDLRGKNVDHVKPADRPPRQAY